MSLPSLKSYLPRGLYERAALILLLPVVVVQIVVFVIFIQRHFEDVTRQMTTTVERQVTLVLSEIAASPSPQDALETLDPLLSGLQMSLRFAPPEALPPRDTRRWYDFSGVIVAEELRRAIPGLARVLLPDNRLVTLFVDTRFGLAQVEFERRRVSATNPHQLLVNMVVFGVLMTVIAFIYLRNQLRPIKRLARAAEAFGRGRHEPYSPSGALEVRAAGTAFLDMRARIERQIEQRTLMLSGVSHDLRTPLTRLRLGLSLIDGEEARTLESDVEEMTQLLDAFLNFAKGDSEGESERVDPIALGRAAVEDAQRAGHAVDVAEMSGAGDVALRPLAIRRALDNLISNAVRYGRRAEVSVVLTERSLRFRVEDDGPGIPEDLRGEAIKPFTRLDPARNQDQGSGVGLGLAIAADIARAHGGVLRLGESARLGGLSADIVIGV